MKELPLFDATEAIVCTIEPHEKPGRGELLDRMRESHAGVRRTESGVVISFSSGSRAIFEEFSISEKRCCPFFGFHVDNEQMVWDAPPAAAEIMDAVYRFFTDDSVTLDALFLVP